MTVINTHTFNFNISRNDNPFVNSSFMKQIYIANWHEIFNALNLNEYSDFVFQVKRAVQQTGFLRAKRGYKPLNGVLLSDLQLSSPDLLQLLSDEKDFHIPHANEPSDPLFPKEWYLVSEIQSITKTYLYNFDPLKPHFYIVKLGFTGVYIIFLISAQKHRLWVLVRTASMRRF